MDKIQFALERLRSDPNNNKYTDEELIAIYGLNQPSFNQGKTGIISNLSFPSFNLPTSLGDIKNLGGKVMGGLMSYATGIPFLGPIIGNIAQPAPSDLMGRDYMANTYGLDNIGRIQSGIMQGYTPVNLMGVGMIESVDKRMNKILARKEAGKSYSQKNLDELQKLQADLIANEKANTYAPVVTQTQKQYFSGGGDGSGFNQASYDAGKASADAQEQSNRDYARGLFYKGGLTSL